MALIKNKIFLLVGILVTVTVLILISNLGTDVIYDRSHANVLEYESLEELEKEVDLVIEAQVIGNSKNVKNPTEVKESPYQLENPYVGYTTTDIKVKKVLIEDVQRQKLTNPEKIIQIIEPMYQVEGENTIITFNDYSPLMKGNNYILFLTWHEEREQYEIHALSKGKYSVDGTDTDEEKLTKDNKNYQDLRKQVIDKYK
ncbi:hypothetical protein AJ85_12900 [Alkalihalobacillus alcalophilus ATCC 27647 = CGMCC 1.3604]|uniref:Uncharacterized protein n=1 Tax=Alkalihalobacillus alcalophilus ATCC 27647 = CGMCC 1.3604 TaxID=1218173 RepID=A0A094WPI7_ALKAL|nr:hypothetical protein [Alkalihalobacillus alcalophilus]KGA97928.1 hypothetical protein BALCAV_0207130 [Alkalihalobacillus alcalophilus ATCC 27647 = CGMCC 1.3604]MED1562705.1 hypothetical protein [Alkalihalobacillus alcalophilus]THG92331.1 hypothetical protein AJ85_12900 [Alkalihalobacillus alcalophilus ATCC 27647 = CGMCC 1.3604]